MTETLAPEQRLNRISQDAMCTACGLCQSFFGAERVAMAITPQGDLRPVIKPDASLCHTEIDRLEQLCPGTRLEALPDSFRSNHAHNDLIWGGYESLQLAWATDPAVRHQGSTGGVLSALALYLLDSGKADFILHAKASDQEPSFGQRQVSHTAADVMAGAGSRYAPTAILVDVLAQLEKGRPFAVVGKPCDLAVINNLAREDERVDRLIVARLSPACGGYMPPEGQARFIQQDLGLDPRQISAMRYRGFGCPGPTRIELADGRVIEKTYSDFWGQDESQWILPFRCKVCADGIGEAGDIAAADTWPGGSPDPDVPEDQDLGTNALIIRSQRGLSLVKRAEAAGFLTLGEKVSPAHLDSVQPHQRKKKLAVAARYRGLASEGKICPKTTGLRLDQLDRALGLEESQRQEAGTRQRVAVGKASEPSPVAAAWFALPPESVPEREPESETT